MAIGIDTSKWKPRKIKGTPAAKFRNVLGVSILAFGVISGLLFHFASPAQRLLKAIDGIYEDPIKEVERRQMIAGGFSRSAGMIRKLIEESERPDRPDKYNSKSCTVVSKYFSGDIGMDESLSDFKEKKKNFEGPKNKTNIGEAKSKQKKTRKRVKGQKDIRTALKSKKNELITYSKDFDSVCKQSGIDVDSEQLQLAIALSKSLQPTENCDSQISQASSQNKSTRIRTTLQEYGFTIPEIKITSQNKKLKKHRKNFKLVLLSDTEKQQNITDKYSQILFQNIDCIRSINVCNSNAKLYNMTTGISYDDIRDNNIFYVDNLLSERSIVKGSQLKDWSTIPGRPVSPKPCKNFTMDLSEIKCSQEELDIMLSSSLKTAQHIIIDRIKKGESSLSVKDFEDNNIIHIRHIDNDKKNTNIVDNVDILIKHKNAANSDLSQECAAHSVSKISLASTITDNVRSSSPDIFDDETDVFDNSIENINSNTSKTQLSNDKKDVEKEDIVLSNSPKDENSVGIKLTQNSQVSQRCDVTKGADVMELTECVGISNQNDNLSGNVLHSNLTGNATKRKSNDFMDLTECISYTSQQNPQRMNCDKIDLVQNCDGELNIVKFDTMDLTQSSNSSEEDLPFVHMSDSKNNSLDETIILSEHDINAVNVAHENEDMIREEPFEKSIDKVSLDSSVSTTSKLTENHKKTVSDYKGNESNNSQARNSIVSVELDQDFDQFDLTQSTSSSEDLNAINGNIDESETSQNKSNLGKIDEVSIDYDEVYNINNEMASDLTNLSKSKNCHIIEAIDPSILDVEICSVNQEISTQSSQESDVFEISDKEFDYSVHKSRIDIEQNIGDISEMDNMLQMRENNLENQFNSSNDFNNHDSFLPEVQINKKNITEDTCTSKSSTPCSKSSALDKIKTPNNSEYLIKTDQITPILDYGSMSTPDRNKELDKYGLKPLKRKRAIQLLTHIYNQTHPIVKQCVQEELLSPSKRQKTESNKSSPKKQESPRKKVDTGKALEAKDTINKSSQKKQESPRKKVDRSKALEVKDIYVLTNENIDLRDIECGPDDWMFQKREKAKVPSCRVPLHITFHNYVSCHRKLREAILRYEPINIDIVHKELVASGYRYDPKDLLKFMDKKCITVKTADNNSRNNRS